MRAEPNLPNVSLIAGDTSHILIIDDDHDVRHFLSSSLEAAGFSVASSASAAEARESVSRRRPSLILCDVRMPTTDGLEFLRELRADPRVADIPVVIVSGVLDAAVKVKGFEAGACDYLTKPVDARELSARVRIRLKQRAVQNALAIAALIDDLTGVANRRGLMGALSRSIDWGHRNQAPVSLLMLDVDRFKAINDLYGHKAGDDVLATMGSALQRCVRGGDIVGRLGGDEFVVVLPTATEQIASGIAERLRGQLTEQIFTETSLAPVTVSIGVATCDIGDRRTHKQLLEAADRRLYRDKHRAKYPS